jgi:WD40 repeat protein/tRNA A-37 threonylcarbamoyl transferase component Bud32
MNTDPADTSEHERRLNGIVVAYLHGLEAGSAPDPKEIVASNPDLAGELAEIFDDLDQFDRLLPTGPEANGFSGGGTTVDESTPRPDPGPAADFAVPGTLGRFELHGVLGQGAHGTVYEAWDTQLPRLVAIKVPRADHRSTAEDRERFLRGGRNAARLHHPAIVEVIDVGEADGVPYLVQALVPGPTLAAVLRQEQHYTPHEAARLLATVADALQYAHEQDVIHRDVKPSNILLGADGTPHLTDFGLARYEADTTITADGRMLGTIAYMSPEQARGEARRVDGRTDVYSLGVVLYLLLTHELPFRGSELLVLHQVLNDQPRPPRSLNDRVPRDLETICLRAMAKAPGRRYASAREMADDLRRFVAGQPILARPVGRVERLGLWCRRNPALAAAMSLAAAASVVTAVWAVRERDHAQALTQALDEAKYRSAENDLYRGQVLCESGDAGAGLWLARSLEKAPANADQLRHTVQVQFDGWVHRVLPLRTCFDDPGPITAAALSPDGRTVWTAGQDKTLRRWDVARRQPAGPPRPLAATVRLVAWSPDGAVVLTIDDYGTAQRWDAATGERRGGPRLHTLALPALGASTVGLLSSSPGQGPFLAASALISGITPKVLAAAWCPGGRAYMTGSEDGSVRLWDTATGDALGPGFRQKGRVTALAVSPDRRTILTGGENSARFWDAATGQSLGEPLPHSAAVVAAAFSPDGRAVVTADTARFTQRWDVATHGPLGRPVRHKSSITALAFSPNGRTLLVGGYDRSARLLDPTTGQSASLMHQATVLAAIFSADGRTILTASSDGAVRLWEAAADQPHGLTLQHDSQVWTAVFSPDGRTVLTACVGNAARLWDATSGKLLGTFPHPRPVLKAAFSPDGRTILTLCWDKKVRLWDVASGQQICPPLDHPTRVNRAVFSPDGRTVLTGEHDGSVRFWDAATGALRRGPVPAHGGPVMAVAFSLDGRTACTGSEDGTVRLWDGAAGQPFGPILRHQDTVLALAFSPTGRTLLSGSSDGTARLWDIATGQSLGLSPRHNGRVGIVAFSPDGRTVLTASEDGTARLWDAVTRAPVGRPLVHHDQVAAAAFRRDSRAVLTGSYDGTARLWDVATGKSLGPPLPHDWRVWIAAFSPDGRTVLTGGEDHTARLSPVPAPALGTPDQIALQAEVFTGLTLDADDVTHVLDAASWHARRARLKELDGTLSPTGPDNPAALAIP